MKMRLNVVYKDENNRKESGKKTQGERENKIGISEYDTTIQSSINQL